jgi:hypothetical protein
VVNHFIIEKKKKSGCGEKNIFVAGGVSVTCNPIPPHLRRSILCLPKCSGGWGSSFPSIREKWWAVRFLLNVKLVYVVGVNYKSLYMVLK